MNEKTNNSSSFARMPALRGLSKDIIYRTWNGITGGVYGFVSDVTTPNLYLAPMLRITTNHHCGLEVESEERQGKIFSIHLPFDGREQTNLNTVGQTSSE